MNIEQVEFSESFQIVFTQEENDDQCRIAHDNNPIHHKERGGIIHFSLIAGRMASEARNRAMAKGIFANEPRVGDNFFKYHGSIRANRIYTCAIEVIKYPHTKSFVLIYSIGNRFTGRITGTYSD